MTIEELSEYHLFSQIALMRMIDVNFYDLKISSSICIIPHIGPAEELKLKNSKRKQNLVLSIKPYIIVATGSHAQSVLKM